MTWQEYLKKIEVFLDDLLVKKAPALGKGIKDLIVTILPWVSLIFGLLGLLGSLGGLGLSSIFAPFLLVGGRKVTLSIFVFLILSLLQSGLELLAVPSLFKKAKKGWQYLFYSCLIGVLGDILRLSVFGLVFQLVVFYFLFQVKAEYR